MKNQPSVFRWICLIVVLTAIAATVQICLVRALKAEPLVPPKRLPIAKHVFEPADVATVKTWTGSAVDPHFLQMHQLFLAQAKASRIDLLFLGDSITFGWSNIGKLTWDKNFLQYDPANFGLAGDRTQHLLWRIENGELANMHPKVVVLLIGTNNTDYPAADITRADIKIVSEIRQKLPESKLLLLGIFPREFRPDDEVRQKIRQVNAQLSKLDDGLHIRYLDIGDHFLTSAGTARIDLLPDLLHPSAKGYQIWANAMQPLLDEMMK